MLVTGGCGFIGSHLVEALVAHGAAVRVLGRYTSTSSPGFLSPLGGSIDLRLGDVADPWFVRSAMRGIDTVFHLAALIGIPYSYAAPEQYVRTNVQGTLAVLEAARSEGVRRVVHTSTSETYGSAQYAPMDERHPLVAQSPYAASKIAADKLAESYFCSFALPVTTVRPFNTFGPRQSLRAVIPSLMAQALYGDHIAVGALTPVRDMNDVRDTVAGFLAIADADGVLGSVYNIGSGRGRSIAEIVAEVQRVAGVDKPVRVSDERLRPAASEVDRLVCDYSRAAAAFGYAPAHDFGDSLARVRDHLRDQPRGNVAAYRV